MSRLRFRCHSHDHINLEVPDISKSLGFVHPCFTAGTMPLVSNSWVDVWS